METYNTIEISAEGFAFDTATGNSFVLNQSAALILRDLQQGLDEDQASAHLARAFSLPAARAQQDVADFRTMLSNHGLDGGRS